MFATIDAEDFKRVSDFRWYARRTRRNYYAVTHLMVGFKKYRKIYLHRFIMEAPTGVQVDHVNGNGLENQKINLRLCTSAENNRAKRRKIRSATSRFRGVSFETQTQQWKAQIRANKSHTLNLGRFFDEVSAAKAYDEAAKHYFGEFAHLNFP